MSYDSANPVIYCLECALKHGLGSHAVLLEVDDRLRHVTNLQDDPKIVEKLLYAQGQLIEVGAHTKDSNVRDAATKEILNQIGRQARAIRIELRDALNKNEPSRIAPAIQKNWKLVTSIQNAIFQLDECESCNIPLAVTTQLNQPNLHPKLVEPRKTLISSSVNRTDGAKSMASFTSILDGKMSEHSAIAYGTEIIAALIDFPVDFILKGLGAKAAKLVGGVITGLTAHYGQNYWSFLRENPRLRQEMHEIAAHLIVEAFDPSPNDIRLMADQLRALRENARFGASWRDQLKVLTYSQPEMVDSINQMTSAIGIGRARGLIRQVQAEPAATERTVTSALVERTPGPGAQVASVASPAFGLTVFSAGAG